MIYAIRAVGTEFVKIGRANSVGRRLKELDTGCPHELHIEAVANWPDGQESAIHLYLSASAQKLEWFRDSERTAKVIDWLKAGEAGLRAFRVEFIKCARELGRIPGRVAAEYERPSSKRGEFVLPPIDVMPADPAKAHERYERIKERALAKQAAKRSQAPAR